MDDLSVSLILSLQLEDVDTLLRGSKGKNPEGRPSDAEIALVAYREELQKNEIIFTDRRMGESISEAVQRDGPIIATTRLEEHNAIRDRELACHLGGVQIPKRIALEDFAEIAVDDDVVRRLRTLNIPDIDVYDDDDEDNKASSSKTSRGGNKALGKKKQCVACQEDRPISDTLAAPCTHNYCRDCVSGLFEAATTDESLFPPRCCRQTIPLTLVKTFLSAALIERFKAKAVEFKTPNRTYCFRPTCSAFIPTEGISGDIATCPDCLQTTCTVCKSASHAGDCPNDTALQSLLHTASANGWQRCYACRRLVELELGCNHMTCVCRAEFCYICGQRWKNCPCPQWNEDRLLARATQVVRRGNPLNPANEQQHIQRAADNLRERHECTHESWSTLPFNGKDLHYIAIAPIEIFVTSKHKVFLLFTEKARKTANMTGPRARILIRGFQYQPLFANPICGSIIYAGHLTSVETTLGDRDRLRPYLQRQCSGSATYSQMFHGKRKLMEKLSASINEVSRLIKTPWVLYNSPPTPSAAPSSGGNEKPQNNKRYPTMPASIKKYKAAAVQAEPGWFDLDLSVEKTIHWINEAGKAGCKLVAFPEVWIPGYPYWMWKINYKEALPFLKTYRENSLPSDSEQMRKIRAAARDNGIYVSLGYSEIDMATLHLAQVLISPTGDILNHRRKIRPTHVERLIFGDGSGDTMESVVDTDIGRVGQLNCWENMNPFLKAYAASLGEQVHIAAWPIYPDKTTLKYPDPYTNVSDPNSDIVSPAYAIETGTFVLAPFQRLSAEGVRKNTPSHIEEPESPDCYNGHTRIFGPDGTLLAKPSKDFEGLVLVDIDLDEAHLPKALADFGGHYMRPDLIRLLVDTRRKELITHADQQGSLGVYNTRDRVGLSQPLDAPTPMPGSVKKAAVPVQEMKQQKYYAEANGFN